MNNSGDNTHKPRAVNPETFRAKATGIGQSQNMSLATGTMRNMRVSASIPEHCRKAVPPAEGFVSPPNASVPEFKDSGFGDSQY